MLQGGVKRRSPLPGDAIYQIINTLQFNVDYCVSRFRLRIVYCKELGRETLEILFP